MIHSSCGTEIRSVHFQIDGNRRKYRGYCTACKRLVSLKIETITLDERNAKYHDMTVELFHTFVKHQHAWRKSP